jgi:hypothetical protein
MFSAKSGRVRSWKFTEWGDELPVDVKLEDARPQDFDALHLPGRRHQPDKFRIIPEAVAFARAFFGAGKPVAATGDRDRVYSRPTHDVIASLKTDIENAGAGSDSQDEAGARLTDHAGRTQIYHALGVACPSPRPAFSAASWAKADQSRSP